MKVIICDTTLRDGEQTPGVHFGPAQKLDIAKRLARCGIDVIESGFPASSEGDFAAVRDIAAASGAGEIGSSTISALARLVKGDIDRAAEALASASRKRLHIFIATSDIHLEYKLKITRSEASERVRECVTYAKGLGVFDEIEFSAEDATRSDIDYLSGVMKTAAECGADVLNVPDTVGYTTPDEFRKIIARIKNDTSEYGCAISVHCHNDLGMATANSIAAVCAGATQVECTVNGLGERAGNAAMEEVVMALRVRSDVIRSGGEALECGVNTREITETSRLVSSISGVAVSPNKAVVGTNAFSHASGIHQHGVMNSRLTYEIMAPEDIGLRSSNIVLGKLSGRHAFIERVRELGYTLSEAGYDAAFMRFKEIADKKNVVADDDIRAIIGEYLDSIEGRYYLESFQIQSGNKMKSMALLSLIDKRENKIITEAAPGEGPIDAAFNAIARLAGAEEAELISFGINAVTEGTDALGEAKVKIKLGEAVYTGRGVSTDVIKAAIKAYLGAINKAKM